MRSILLKVINTKPSSNFNSVNRLNKSNINNYKPVSPLSHKGKTFTRASLHEILSDLLVDNNENQDANIGIEDVIKVNESESTLIVN